MAQPARVQLKLKPKAEEPVPLAVDDLEDDEDLEVSGDLDDQNISDSDVDQEEVGPVDDTASAVETASVADTASTMEGGWKRGTTKVSALSDRLSKKAPPSKYIIKHGKSAGKLSLNKARTFKASVNGTTLKGQGVVKKYKTAVDKATGEKKKALVSSAKGETNRYFHGDPSGAAKKVIAILHKGQKKGLPGSKNVLGRESAVRIDLTEVTKGVRKANGDRFRYSYFGWREEVPEEDQKEHPTAVYPKGHPLEGQKVRFTARNKVVPVRGASSANEAEAKSHAIGSEIKRLKSLTKDERDQVRATKEADKKAKATARKEAKKTVTA